MEYLGSKDQPPIILPRQPTNELDPHGEEEDTEDRAGKQAVGSNVT